MGKVIFRLHRPVVEAVINVYQLAKEIDAQEDQAGRKSF